MVDWWVDQTAVLKVGEKAVLMVDWMAVQMADQSVDQKAANWADL